MTHEKALIVIEGMLTNINGIYASEDMPDSVLTTFNALEKAKYSLEQIDKLYKSTEIRIFEDKIHEEFAVKIHFDSVLRNDYDSLVEAIYLKIKELTNGEQI